MRRRQPWLWTLLASCVLIAAWALLGDLGARAFDPSDPVLQLRIALAAAAMFRARGPLGWFDVVVCDPMAKPVQTLLLSSGLLAGLPASDVGYQAACGLVVLGLLALLVWASWRWLGGWAAAAAAALALSSNIALEQAYYGGHSWYGQLLLWAGAACGLDGGKVGIDPRPGRRLAAGALLSGSFLASYHMAAPAASALILGCVGCLLGARDARAAVRGAWPLLAGAALPFALLGVGGALTSGEGYWRALREMRRLTAPGEPTLGYFLDLLLDRESAAYGAALGALAAAGAAVLWRRWRGQGDRAAAFLLLWPASTFLLLLLPSSPRLERAWLAELGILLLPAGAGAAEGLRWMPSRRRPVAAAAATALLWLSNAPKRQAIVAAFHAGRDIVGVLARDGSAAHLVVIGPSLPFAYLRGSEVRVKSLEQVRELRRRGERWVLVSSLSAWWWNGFMPAEDFDIPVERVYAAAAPYVEVPGVESLGFTKFSNYKLYELIRRGAAPFPRSNRLYRIDDFLRACRG